MSDIIANDALPVLSLFQSAFHPSVFHGAQLLAVAAILTTGRRTVSNLLRTLACLADGAPSSYHRVLSQARWSGLCLAASLCRLLLLRLLPASGVVRLAGDDTVSEHRGRKVYGKARHRDAVRSSRSYTAFRWGHKWAVLCVPVDLPFASRPWALPVLAALCRSEQDDKERGRPHKSPAQVMILLLRILLRWFPQRRFRFAGDAGFGSHEVACLARRSGGRLAVVSRFRADGNLYEPPPVYSGKGRPRVVGRKMAKPREVVARSERTRERVSWYGGGTREVEVVTGTGWWYHHGAGLVGVRWVYVRDAGGTRREEYFYSTDAGMTAREIIEAYVGRWYVETMFQEMRAHLGLETTRGRCEKTVLRAEPMLFGLYSVVALLYARLSPEEQAAGGVHWEGKQAVTFSDAISAVRRWLWTDWVFVKAGHAAAFEKLPRPLRQALLSALAPAA